MWCLITLVVLLLMADYFTVVDLLGVQAIGYFQCDMGNGRFFYSSFHLEETMGLE
jgi:hypothetical protein